MPPSFAATKHRLAPSISWALLGLAFSTITLAQSQPASPATQPVDDIHIIMPTVDKANRRVTIAGAFWKEDVADWCETALSGRPSDFLHETFICTTTTRTILEKAFREAGFHDADAWVDGVRDFPKVRGDRFLVLVHFNWDGEPQVYSLDELIGFQGWGDSAGPFGFMFKGDPGKKDAPLAPPPPPATTEEADRTKILRDDPQIALTFKGLQNMSQSFADHPLCYDDWIYPMMNIARNYAALSPKVLTSNGDVPVTIVFQKCTEEEFLTESAKVWHDAQWSDLMVKNIPLAREIDKNKAELWKLRQGQPETRQAGALTRADLLTGSVAEGYATLDYAWAKYSAEHVKFGTLEPTALLAMQEEAQRWSTHMRLTQQAVAARSRSLNAAVAQQELKQKPTLTDADNAQLQKLRGAEIEQLSVAVNAENQQESDYWRQEKARLNPTDPRSAWIAAVDAHVELIDARDQSAAAGVAYGRALQADAPPANLNGLQAAYGRTLALINLAQARIQLAETEFEITKREGFDNDPELPGLKEKKVQLEKQIQDLQASTQPK